MTTSSRYTPMLAIALLTATATAHADQVSFVEPRALPVPLLSGGDGLGGVAVADFDGDTRPDIAVTYNNQDRNYLGVLLNDGGGAFQAPVSQFTGSNTGGAGMIARDFDGDGVMDVAVAFPTLRQVLFFQGRGDGTFARPRPSPVRHRCTGMQVGRLDGDAFVDLVTVNPQDNSVSVLLGNGDGTFHPATATGFDPVDVNPQTLAVADVTGDQIPDLLVGSYDAQSVGVLAGTGDGTFLAPTAHDARGQVTALALGDFDGDTHTDVLIGVAGGPRTHAIALMRGTGGGAFAPPADADFLPTEAFPARYYIENTAPDLDGDHLPDAVFGARANLVAVVRGSPSGVSLAHYVASPGPTTPAGAPDGNAVNAAAIADFNGDGALDILTASSDIYGGRMGGLALLSGDPAAPGTFRAPRSYFARVGWPVGTRGLLLGEFTNDAHTDLLAFSGTFDVMAGAGDGTFPAPPTLALGTVSGPGEFYNTLRAADLDGNSKPDLVWIGTGGVQGGPGPRYLIAYADDSGAFANDRVAVYPTPWGAGQNLQIADLDGDADLDLVFFAIAGGAPSHGEFEIFLNDGPATHAFTRLPGKPATGTLAFYPASGFVLGDFDADGALDLVTHAATGYTYSSRYLFFKGNRDAATGHGDGTFQPEVDFAVDLPPYTEFTDMRAADLDHDGHLDLVGGGAWGGVWVLRGDGQGGFAAPTVFDTGGGVRDLRIIDLDGDGELDLASATNHGVSVLTGLGDGNFTAPLLFAVGHGDASSFDLADLDGDGTLDALTGSSATNNDDFVVLRGDSGPRADLALTAGVTPATFDASETVLTFTFTATNKGPDAAPAALVRVPTRVGEILLDATTSVGTCQPAPDAVTCALGALAPDASATVTLQVVGARAGALGLSASIASTTADPATGNNSAVATAQSVDRVTIEAPANLEVGAMQDFVVRYVNTDMATRAGSVLVFDLPMALDYISSSKGGTYYRLGHRVFWRLGDLPPQTGGSVSLRLRTQWGVPVHIPFGFQAWLGWATPGGSPIDVQPYLDYLPREVLADDIFGADDVDTFLADHPAAAELFAHAQSEGYAPTGVGRHVAYSDASAVDLLWLVRPDSREAAVIDVTSDGAIGYRLEPGRFSLVDATGGFTCEAATGDCIGFGAWAQVHSITQQECLRSCLLEKIPGDLLGDIFKFWNIIGGSADCADCAGSSDQASCEKCFGANYIPLGSSTVDVAACARDCIACDEEQRAGNPTPTTCHVCTPGDKRWSCDKISGWLNPAGWVRTYEWTYTECNSWGIWGPVDHTSCRGLDCQECNPGKCEPPDAACTQIPALTAGDPNDKVGPRVAIAGDTLAYTIHYENVGLGTAYGVYVIDELPPELDETTLTLPAGAHFLPRSRRVTFRAGDLAPGATGSFDFTIKVKAETQLDTEIVNRAWVVFPSVPSQTPTNPVVSIVRALRADDQKLATAQRTPLAITLTGNDGTGPATTFTVLSGPANGTLGGTAPALTYTPAPSFDGLDQFTFVVTRDALTSAPATVTIRVDATPANTTAPTVVAVAPAAQSAVRADTATDLPGGTYAPTIIAYMSKPLDPTTVTPTSVRLLRGTTPVPSEIRWNGLDQSIVLFPLEPLAPGETYEAELATPLADNSGNHLAAAYRWTFTTFPVGDLAVSPAALDFAAIRVGSAARRALHVQNTAATPTTISAVTLGGSDASDFTVTDDGCSGITIELGGSCQVEILFTPTAPGPKAATLTLTSSSAVTPTLAVALAATAS